ncbi:MULTISPECIES: Npun_R2821/Npun_R2822 family protein [Trichocoleus]|uniref:Uncharacterized protein n=1 Tax=Trichocoleus desertorum GB2-A4 TaxID=2933944 RepID=A0ABV0J5F8_9CYAN|nr:Npun_R2821/Npun_R2822 family protein [Trichocoleus sp. FACHB-46]MBD1861637.1 hypothetical protein [Trichocoleus sp. FACHB-46]
MQQGIYVVANNNVYDQLVALLNSVEANYSRDIPICVIPYNNDIDLIKKEITKRKNVSLFENQAIIEKWERFVTRVQALYYDYPSELGSKKKKAQKVQHSRKYCAFDGEFDKFIFIDCDTLVFRPLNHIFQKLDDYDFIVHDFQRKTSSNKNTIDSFIEVFQDSYGSTDVLSRYFHCSGFWGAKRGAITELDLEVFLQDLASGEIRIFGDKLSEQRLLNYMTLKKLFKPYNLTFDGDSEYCTGVCVTSKHFEEKQHILYDKGKRLTYLHYMGVSNELFGQLCEWQKSKIPFKNALLPITDKLFDRKISSIPYKDVFVHYRFLYEA